MIKRDGFLKTFAEAIKKAQAAQRGSGGGRAGQGGGNHPREVHITGLRPGAKGCACGGGRKK